MLEIILLQFSTGEYHPLARNPQIYVQDSSSRRPAIAMEIVGESLALVVNNRGGRFRDKLFIFNWKTGHKKLVGYCFSQPPPIYSYFSLRIQYHEAAENAYASLVFISPEILIIPNVVHGQYEVWKIPKETDIFPHQILGLQFPALSKGHFILNLSCRGEPNPFLHDIPHAPPRPFHTSVDNAIIITIIHLASFPGLFGSTSTLVMHRRALLDAVINLTSPEKPLPPGIRQHHNDARVFDLTGDMPYSLSSAVTADAQAPYSAPAPGAWYSWYSIPWSKWGPPISRWFDDDQSLTRWITTSAGQRWAVLKPVDRENYQISMIDFNPYNIRHAPSDLPGELVVERQGIFLNHGDAFAEKIEMGLGCTIYTAPEIYDFDGLLMEEERLLGLKVCIAMAFASICADVGRPTILGMFKRLPSSILAEKMSRFTCMIAVLYVCNKISPPLAER